MAKYYGYVSVPHATYDQFRAAVLYNGYDVDYSYGCQCYDMALLFWNNVGFPQGYPLSSGIGANGIWDRRNENIAYNGTTYFSLIPNLADVKRGDVIIYSEFSGNPFGHIGFADQDYAPWHAANPGNYEFPILSQNNGGTVDPDGGSYNNIHGYDTRLFRGAFRYIPWGGGPTPPTPGGAWRPSKSKFPWVLVTRNLRNQRGGNEF